MRKIFQLGALSFLTGLIFSSTAAFSAEVDAYLCGKTCPTNCRWWGPIPTKAPGAKTTTNIVGCGMGEASNYKSIRQEDINFITRVSDDTKMGGPRVEERKIDDPENYNVCCPRGSEIREFKATARRMATAKCVYTPVDGYIYKSEHARCRPTGITPPGR